MNRAEVKQMCIEIYDCLQDRHIKAFKNMNSEDVLISDTYPGVWIEHTFDAVALAAYNNRFIQTAKIRLCFWQTNRSRTDSCYYNSKRFDTISCRGSFYGKCTHMS